MTKELAVRIMGLKDVYLTSEGKRQLEQIMTSGNKETSKNV